MVLCSGVLATKAAMLLKMLVQTKEMLEKLRDLSCEKPDHSGFRLPKRKFRVIGLGSVLPNYLLYFK
jgi:hypothetical protein